MPTGDKPAKSRTPKAPKEAKPTGPRAYKLRGRPGTGRLSVRVADATIESLGLKLGDRVVWNGATIERVKA